MDELSIKVVIANRTYPLKINRADEENVRRAASVINEKVSEYEQNFAVRDKQDLLAMCALHMATESLNVVSGDLKDELNGKITSIDNMLGAYLAEVDRPV